MTIPKSGLILPVEEAYKGSGLQLIFSFIPVLSQKNISSGCVHCFAGFAMTTRSPTTLRLLLVTALMRMLLIASFLAHRSNAFSALRSVVLRSTANQRSFSSNGLAGGAPPRLQRGARSRQRERKSQQDDVASPSSTLEWEKFEFADAPKWDRRFENDGEDNDGSAPSLHLASNDEEWKEIEKRETKEDVALQQRFERQHRAWQELDPELVAEATHVLVPYIQPCRWDRIKSILQHRTQQTRFLFENPSNPSNVWACLRTLDSFGIQHVDVVIQSGQYSGKAALVQKRGMRTAMGSAKWLTLRNHLSTRHALERIRNENYHILYTDVNPSSKDIRDLDWDLISETSSDDENTEGNGRAQIKNKKLCIVMGNEQDGVSDVVKEMADQSFYLPMAGFAESFNLSVATAITCAHLSAASKDGKGPLRPGDLSQHEYDTLLLKGALNSIKHRTARALLKSQGVVLPKDLPL